MSATVQKVQVMGKEVQLLSEENTKYGFGSETLVLNNGIGTILHRIVALRDIVGSKGGIIARKGEKGGFIEKESNLDYESNAWVGDDAVVCGDSWVGDDARLHGKTVMIKGELRLFDVDSTEELEIRLRNQDEINKRMAELRAREGIRE